MFCKDKLVTVSFLTARNGKIVTYDMTKRMNLLSVAHGNLYKSNIFFDSLELEFYCPDGQSCW